MRISRVLPIMAPILFVGLWATGFVGARATMPFAEPMTFLSIRFAVASLAMAALALAFGSRWPRSPVLIAHTAFAGLLIHAIYLGGVFMAVRAGLEAGSAALIVGAQPAVTAVLAVPLLGETIGWRKMAGLSLGGLGIVVFVGEKLQAGLGTPLAVLFCLASLVGIALGMVYQKRFVSDVSILSGAAIQYAASLLVTLPLALGLETGGIDWSPSFVIGLFWLTFVLSVGAVSLLYWLIKRGAATNVASLFFLVPPVAAMFGYILYGETIGVLAMVGMAMVAIGVWLVNWRRPVQQQPPG